MPLNVARIRQCLQNFDFRTLFVQELGWDKHLANISVVVDRTTYSLQAIAEKRGFQVFECPTTDDREMPDHPTRSKIERQLAKAAHEHIIIHTNSGKSVQKWQWVRRELGRPLVRREHDFSKGQTGELLAQKLQYLAVELSEEEDLTLVDVTRRARKAFDVDRVTKRFYDRFKAEHDAFLEFVTGIPDEEMGWYASVILNRLMFIYFIQKKGFLSADRDYLSNKLAQCRRKLGENRYYRDFLCPLFFEGFAKREEERSEQAKELLGEVPYLNGGIFMPHQIEQLHGKTIAIPDKAFEKLFDFFGAYQWHLDDRPTSRDNEIRPDVLGYIFEKYINQKQMGAYYTKVDITEYISKNTVIPFLFGKAKERCRVAFEGPQSVWQLLRDSPDRYIYAVLRRGVIDDQGNVIPESALPDFVQKGMRDSKERMFNRDYNLRQALIPDADGRNLALPSETWREYVERRKRCLELRERLTRGEVRDINELITYNLDIRQFAQDVIENTEGPELVRAFWRAINELTVLDPACGSGAFLFAALNILEPLYEACLDRMRVFVDELDRSKQRHSPKRYADFRKVLQKVAEHPNESYFVLKSIVVNNLFGVDIIEEATEICKLRLFLKLVAQVERVEDLEPLPDIDFNIRAGNTLVGFVTLDEIRHAAERDAVGQGKIVFSEVKDAIGQIENEADIADRAFQQFRMQQTELGGTVTADDKRKLTERLGKLARQLDWYLAGEYGIDAAKEKNAYAKWHASHRPFHWFAEFYGIVEQKGFDVIIGNPPYVEYRNVQNEYSVRGFQTENCGNLYAFFIERSLSLSSPRGRFGMIVPISFMSSERMSSVRASTLEACSTVWLSSFAIRPQPLFREIMQRNTVLISETGKQTGKRLLSTNYIRWFAIERDMLFAGLTFVDVTEIRSGTSVIPKIESATPASVLGKMREPATTLIGQLVGTHTKALYFHDSGESYWTKTVLEKPIAYRNGVRVEPTQWFRLELPADEHGLVYLLLSSSLFYWFWTVYTDCRHMTKGFIQSVPLPPSRNVQSQLVDRLRQAYAENTILFEKREGYESPEITVHNFKPLLDEIDSVLAKYYGFTSQELDYIINYDIKYRVSQPSERETRSNRRGKREDRT